MPGPTVIKTSPGMGLGERRKPTIISIKEGEPPMSDANAPKGRKPTVIGGGSPPSEPSPAPQAPVQARRGPTAIKPSPAPAAAPATPLPVHQPTAIAGTARKNLDVDVSDLAQRFAGTPAGVLALARDILRQIVLELLTEAYCRAWGEEHQKRFGELTDQSIVLAAAKPAQDAAAHLARLHALLGEIDEAFAPKGSGGFFSWAHAHADPKSVFERHRDELLQLRRLLEGLLPEIVRLEEAIVEIETKLIRLGSELNAHSIAAGYLAARLDKNDQEQLIRSLEERSASLLQTVAHIQQGAVLRQTEVETMRRFSERIKEDVRNALPAWIQSVTAVFGKPTQTETDTRTLRQGLATILQRLQ